MQSDEKTIQTEILNYLKSRGFFAWKNHVGGIRRSGQGTVKNPARGAPDIFAVKEGVFYGIEVKRPGGKVSGHQYAWLQKLRDHGGIAIITTSLESCVHDISEARKNETWL